MVSETLQTQLDKIVIKMVHGDDVPAAYVVVNPPSNRDLKSDLAIDAGLLTLGVKQDPADLAERYGREVVSDQSTVISANEKAPAEADGLDAIRAALADDYKKLGDALNASMQAEDMPAMIAALKKIAKEMPGVLDPTALTDELAKQFTQAYLKP